MNHRVRALGLRSLLSLQLLMHHVVEVGLARSHGRDLSISGGVLSVLRWPHGLASVHVVLLIFQMLARIPQIVLLIRLHLRGIEVSMAALSAILILAWLLLVLALPLPIFEQLLATSHHPLRLLYLLMILLHQLVCHSSKFEL